MKSDIIHAAMATWSARELPARLHADQVAKLLNCTCEDVTILSSAGKLKPLGKPRPNAVKLFSAIELFTLIADRDWLDDATKTIGQFWRRKNARRKGGNNDWSHTTNPDEVPDQTEKPSTKPSTTELKTGRDRAGDGGERIVGKAA
ncbi:hypothetical protein GC207_12910 [bacterium]|nr:hypothetical protein [bacterium]